ncbi:Clr5 domain-containing protein [Aspergillus pseudotamarii]|uniref:Clr5 domain-containing protein n=1 Tax=Aspergillus pseudotamarii TaxID=132259 RepID=A0A5N6T3T5_ASPPS|nr:Clr5 domain-containing protein [Aspergillus pseudotamarii]KAE8140974.1 Clr5 domain-containing protein [Aspergillus pseudotamarii]
MDGSIPPSSAISPISPSPSTSSSIFRPRRSDDWHEYRPIIEQLYRDNQLKLRDVKRIMERDYKFHASEKQYKDRLAAWHVRKNIKAKEVHVMIRKQQKRAARGKQTGFRVAGQEVDSKRIARFVRRYGTHWDNKGRAESQSQSPPQLQPQSQPETQPQTHRSSPEPDTPSDMSCYTPEPDARDRSSTLSPRPETMSPRSHDKLKIEQTPASEIDDNQSLPTTTYSPNLPNDAPKTTDDVSWKDLDSFQNRLLALHDTLEASMAGFIYPNEDENRTPLL